MNTHRIDEHFGEVVDEFPFLFYAGLVCIEDDRLELIREYWAGAKRLDKIDKSESFTRHIRAQHKDHVVRERLVSNSVRILSKTVKTFNRRNERLTISSTINDMTLINVLCN